MMPNLFYLLTSIIFVEQALHRIYLYFNRIIDGISSHIFLAIHCCRVKYGWIDIAWTGPKLNCPSTQIGAWRRSRMRCVATPNWWMLSVTSVRRAQQTSSNSNKTYQQIDNVCIRWFKYEMRLESISLSLRWPFIFVYFGPVCNNFNGNLMS